MKKLKMLRTYPFRVYRWLFGKCDYCGKPIKQGGGRKYGGGTPHIVYESLPSGFPSNEEKIKFACLKCEMDFDED